MNHKITVDAARPRARRRFTTVGIALVTTAALLLTPAAAGAETVAPTPSSSEIAAPTHAPAQAEANEAAQPEAPAEVQSETPSADQTAELRDVRFTGRFVDAQGAGLENVPFALLLDQGTLDGPTEVPGISDTDGRFEVTSGVVVESLEQHGLSFDLGAGWLATDEYWRDGAPVVDGAFALGDIVASRGALLTGAVNGASSGVTVWNGSERVNSVWPQQDASGAWVWSLTVPAGEYTVQLSNGQGSYRELWWGASSSQQGASVVRVDSGATQRLDAELQLHRNVITGRMIDAQGRPAAGDVSVWGDIGSSLYTQTDAQGRYVLATDASGEVTVRFSPRHGVPQYWQDATDFERATRLTLPATGSIVHEGIDATIERGSRVSGVASIIGVEPGSARVALRSGSQTWGGNNDRHGVFSIENLPDGEYRLVLSTNSGELETDRTITVAGADVDLGTIEFALGRITGEAIAREGGWSGSVEIYRSATDTAPTAYASVQDGRYEATVLAGSYLLAWSSADGRLYYDGARSLATATPVVVTAGESVVADFSTGSAELSGSVVDADGEPVAGATVGIYPAHDQDSARREVATDENGAYRFDRLRADNYAVRVIDGGDDFQVGRWVGGDGTSQEASVFALADGASAEAGETRLTLGGAARSTVELPENASLSLYIGERRFDLAEWAQDSADYVFAGLPVGTHPVRLSWSDAVTVSVPETVTITAGAYTELPISVVAEQSLLRGVVTDAVSGEPLREARIELRVADGWTVSSVFTDSVGRYAFTALNAEPGDYDVRVTAPGYREQSLGTVTLTHGTSQQRDAQLAPGASVSGRLVDGATGQPVSGARIVLGDDWRQSATSAEDGSFEIATTRTGRQTLEVEATGTHQRLLRSIEFGDAGLRDIVVSLTSGRTVSGTVLAENNGVPLSNLPVELVDASGYHHTVWTDEAGDFTTVAVAAGDYRLAVTNERGLYVSSSSRVSVGSENITGLDVRLTLGGRIVGVLMGAQGQPIPFATVGLAQPGDDSLFGRIARVFGAQNSAQLLEIETTTDEQGRYELPAVAGGQYALYSFTPETGTTWFDGKRTLAEATRIPVVQGGTATVEVAQRELAEGEVPRSPIETLSEAFAITQQPEGAALQAGQSVALEARASGVPVPTVQWQQRVDGDWVELEGSTEPQFRFATDEPGDYQLRAVFTQGEQTLTTDAVTVTVAGPLEAPAAVDAPAVSSITSTGVTVAWTASARAESYRVQLLDAAGVELRSVSTSALITAFTGLRPETGYRVAVVATNAAGETPAAESRSFSTEAAKLPGAPRAVQFVDVGATSARLTWQAPADSGDSPVTGYVVELRQAGELVERLAPTATSALFAGLAPETAYTVTIAAVSAAGTGADATATVTTPAAPPLATVPDAPEQPRAVLLPSGDVQVDWTAPAEDGGSPVTGYLLRIDVDGVLRPAVGTGSTRYVVTGIASGQTVVASVIAVNAVGESEVSFPSGPVTRPAPIEPTVPNAPAAPSVTALGARSIGMTLGITGGDDITGHVVEVLRGESIVATARLGASDNVTTFADLEPGVRYGVRVAAVNVTGQGGFSPLVSVTTEALAPVDPETPVEPGTPVTPSPEPPQPGTPSPQPPITVQPGVAPATAPSTEQLTEQLRDRIELSLSEQRQGAAVVVGGLNAGERYSAWFFSQPTFAGTHAAGADGRITVTVPKSLAAGQHRLAVQNADGAIVGWAPITITAADAGLANTGAEPAPGALLALALLLLGGGLVVAASPLRRKLVPTRG